MLYVWLSGGGLFTLCGQLAVILRSCDNCHSCNLCRHTGTCLLCMSRDAPFFRLAFSSYWPLLLNSCHSQTSGRKKWGSSSFPLSQGQERIQFFFARVWAVAGPSRAPCNIIEHLFVCGVCVCVCVCVCLRVCSLHKCMRFKQQLESTLHVTSGVGRLYFSSSPWSPTPCRLVLKFRLFVHESAWLYCFNASSGFSGSFHFTLYKVRPTSESIAMPNHGDRERGLNKLSGVDVHVYTSSWSDRLLFRLWQRYGPARAQSGAPLYFTWL